MYVLSVVKISKKMRIFFQNNLFVKSQSMNNYIQKYFFDLFSTPKIKPPSKMLRNYHFWIINEKISFGEYNIIKKILEYVKQITHYVKIKIYYDCINSSYHR